jgi:hypothetical protein
MLITVCWYSVALKYVFCNLFTTCAFSYVFFFFNMFTTCINEQANKLKTIHKNTLHSWCVSIASKPVYVLNPLTDCYGVTSIVSIFILLQTRLPKQVSQITSLVNYKHY